MTVREEIEMLRRQAATIRRLREEMEEELAEIERGTKTRCECDFDCVDDPPRYVRSNRSILCPEHDMCQLCDERLAVAILDGDKLCQTCRDEEESVMKARWAESAGGLCLEVQNPPDHFCDPDGWRILAFITPNVRRTGFIAEIGSGEQIGVGLARRRGSYRTLAEAKAMIVEATGVEIVESI
jgi:hypothetical protein